LPNCIHIEGSSSLASASIPACPYSGKAARLHSIKQKAELKLLDYHNIKSQFLLMSTEGDTITNQV